MWHLASSLYWCNLSTFCLTWLPLSPLRFSSFDCYPGSQRLSDLPQGTYLFMVGSGVEPWWWPRSPTGVAAWKGWHLLFWGARVGPVFSRSWEQSASTLSLASSKGPYPQGWPGWVGEGPLAPSLLSSASISPQPQTVGHCRAPHPSQPACLWSPHFNAHPPPPAHFLACFVFLSCLYSSYLFLLVCLSSSSQTQTILTWAESGI